MNILYITNHLNIGGITSYVLALARGMKEKGHTVYVASSSGSMLERFLKEGIIFWHIPIRTKSEISPKVLASVLKLSSPVKKHDIQIVHANSRTTQVLSYMLAKVLGVANVSTCHGFFKKRFSRKAFPCWGQKVIAISESVRQHLINDLGASDEIIKVIHNGIHIERFKPHSPQFKLEKKKEFGLKDGPVIGIVARLSDVKGHAYLIEAMPSVIQALPKARLLIVGEGKMKPELIALAKRLGIREQVVFIPEVEDTRDVLAAMDLFVMPSLKEGLGLALMEAMASGLAVIGSDVGGIRSLIEHNKNGLLVKPADAKALSGAILRMLSDPEGVYSFGWQASMFIKEHFSQEKMVLETERMYLECLSQR